MIKLIIILLISQISLAQSFRAFMPFKTIKERRKKATLLLRVYDGKKYVNEATAFFVSRDGFILTTFHSLEEYLGRIKNSGWKIELSTHYKKDLGKVRVIRCSEKRTRIDLCLLKLESKFKIKDYFPMEKVRNIKKGDKFNPNVDDHYDFFSFGHPEEGYFVEVSSQLVTHHREPDSKLQCDIFASEKNRDKHLSRIQVKEISKNKYKVGHSGAPLFDKFGKLVGMMTGHLQIYNSNCRRTDKKAMLALPANYLVEFYKKYRD